MNRFARTPQKPVVNSGVPEGLAVPVPLVAAVVLLCYKPGRFTRTPQKSGVNSGAPEVLAVPVPLEAGVVLLCYKPGNKS